MDFVLDNLPPYWEETKSAARKLNQAAKQQREDEHKERQAKWEAQRLERDRQRDEQRALSRKSNNDNNASTKRPKQVGGESEREPKKQRIKTKMVKKQDKDGFMKFENVPVSGHVEWDEAEEKEQEEEEEEMQPELYETPKKQLREDQVDKELLNGNPFSLALKEGSFMSINDVQHKKNMARGKGHLQGSGPTKPQKQQQQSTTVLKKSNPEKQQGERQESPKPQSEKQSATISKPQEKPKNQQSPKAQKQKGGEKVAEKASEQKAPKGGQKKTKRC